LQAIALKRWYSLNKASEVDLYARSRNLRKIAFDGAHLYVTDLDSGSVLKVRASDGEVLWQAPIEQRPLSFDPRALGVAFDGTTVWVTDFKNAMVVGVRPTDGIQTGFARVGAGPSDLAFDGENLWVACALSASVTRIRLVDDQGNYTGAGFVGYGEPLHVPVGDSPVAVLFDGRSLWVANSASDNVMKLRPSDGAVLATYRTGVSPVALAFDGAKVWVAHSEDGTVKQIGGRILRVGSGASVLEFDGTAMWVGHYDGTLLKLSLTGARQGSYSVPSAPITGLAFDGANVWVASGTRLYRR
jgi:DNA-binding beta-propeller fold protein YncE